MRTIYQHWSLVIDHSNSTKVSSVSLVCCISRDHQQQSCAQERPVGPCSLHRQPRVERGIPRRRVRPHHWLSSLGSQQTLAILPGGQGHHPNQPIWYKKLHFVWQSKNICQGEQLSMFATSNRAALTSLWQAPVLFPSLRRGWHTSLAGWRCCPLEKRTTGSLKTWIISPTSATKPNFTASRSQASQIRQRNKGQGRIMSDCTDVAFFVFHHAQSDQYLIINHNFTQSPDRFDVIDSRNGSTSPLSYSNNENGDWYLDNSTNNLYYISKTKDLPIDWCWVHSWSHLLLLCQYMLLLLFCGTNINTQSHVYSFGQEEPAPAP